MVMVEPLLMKMNEEGIVLSILHAKCLCFCVSEGYADAIGVIGVSEPEWQRGFGRF